MLNFCDYILIQSLNFQQLPGSWIVADENPDVLVNIGQSWRRVNASWTVLVIASIFSIARRDINRRCMMHCSWFVEGQSLVRVEPWGGVVGSGPEEILQMNPATRKMLDDHYLVL